MDPHRNYPDDTDSRWYPSEHGYQDPNWDRRSGDEARPRSGYPEESKYGVPARAESADRYPADADRYAVGEADRYAGGETRGMARGYDGDSRGSRYADLSVSEPLGAAPVRTGAIGPRSGEPLPPLPTDSTAETPVGVVNPETVARLDTQPIDRTALRRATAGVQDLGDGVYRSRRPATAAMLVVLTIVFEIPAVRVLTAGFRHIAVAGTVAGTLLVIALPMFALGLYALASGAGAAQGHAARAWLRTPLAYLPLGLVLLVAAALAVA